MKKLVGIRFKPAGKVYDFDCGAFVLKIGDHIIVETEQGLGFGTVATPARHLAETDAGRTFKKVHRMATEKDFQQREKNQARESRAFDYCQQCIKELHLQMNLFNVESAFDASKLTFYFTADGRVDFRQLVKMLVRELGVRIEMRQVGIRNQAKMCGGVGRCGREICCSAHMEKFGPVSIRMAKEQSLSLNPTKISGLCGRLMCCLTFEFETYKALKSSYPKIGKAVQTPSGKGRVVRHNVMTDKISVRLDGGNEIEISPDQISKE